MIGGGRETKAWFEEGRAMGAGFMLVVCDQFDYEDYPVYHPHPRYPGVTPRELVSIYDYQNMQRVYEVYDLNADFEEQVWEPRTWRLPPPPREVNVVVGEVEGG